MPISIDSIWLGDDRYWAEVSDFTYRANGTFSARAPQEIPLSDDEVAAIGSARASELKSELFAQGFASFSDSMYLSMRVLEEEPRLAALVASRFGEIIVDEVQDASDVQMRCLELLVNTGKLSSLVMVGDPDQSIYEWQGSQPQACTAFASSHGLPEKKLTQNFRSSQAICDVVYRLSNRSQPDQAAGPYRDVGLVPEVLFYRGTDPMPAINRFRERLNVLELSENDAPILVRGRSLANRLNAASRIATSWAVRTLGNVAIRYQANDGFDMESLKDVESLIERIAWGPNKRLGLVERMQVRDAACLLVTQLPPLSGDRSLRDWVAEARDVTRRAVSGLVDSPSRKVGDVIRAPARSHERIAAEVFPETVGVPLARTVHSAKGESHPAVLLIGARPSHGRHNARSWIKGELGEERDEETRIGYVALTRAAKYCAVALPDITSPDVLDAYARAGFVLEERRRASARN